MDKKRTIIIAVLINAGLLATLLVAALMTQDEMVVPASTVAAQQIEDKSIDLPIQIPEIKPEMSQELLVHKLPPLAVEPPVPVVVEEPIAEVKVQKGDNLDKIAKLHRTSVDEIIKLNRLSGSILKIGQVLKVPKGTAVAVKPTPKKEVVSEYYTVKVGDTPWTIAMKNHLKVDELLRLNAMNEEKARKLKPGDRLRIR